MKILFVLELYYPNIGGIEKLFMTLTEKLVEEGNEVTVITSRFHKELPARETKNGVHIKRLKISSRFLFTFFGVFGMLREAKHADIIHTTSYNAAFPARLAGLLARKKVIITFHEAWGSLWFSLPFINYLSKLLYFIYEQFIMRLGFYRFIAVSDYTADCLTRNGVRKEKIMRIYNGLDYNNYTRSEHSPPEAFTFTYFGRLGISKGLDILLEASIQFLKNHPEAQFKLIVPGSPASILRLIKQALTKIPRENYTLLHHLDESRLKQEIQRSSCIVIPSYSEGFCFAAAESIALGVPVISSGKGALKEVVSGKYINMQSFDSKGLIEALEKARSEEWEEMPVKEFHFKDTVENYLKLYSELK